VKSYRLTALLCAVAFVMYFARHGGWAQSVSVLIVVGLTVAGLRQLAFARRDEDRTSVERFEARRRALR
jgi:hypothetical protein